MFVIFLYNDAARELSGILFANVGSLAVIEAAATIYDEFGKSLILILIIMTMTIIIVIIVNILLCNIRFKASNAYKDCSAEDVSNDHSSITLFAELTVPNIMKSVLRLIIIIYAAIAS